MSGCILMSREEHAMRRAVITLAYWTGVYLVFRCLIVIHPNHYLMWLLLLCLVNAFVILPFVGNELWPNREYSMAVNRWRARLKDKSRASVG